MQRITSLVSASLVALLTSSLAEAQWWRAPLSLARTNMVAVATDDLVLFAGGRVGSTVIEVIDIYHPATDTWTDTTLPAPKSNVSATTMGHLIFFAGGVGQGFAVSNVVDILDTQTMTWSSATLSEARAIVGMTTVGSKVLVAGGGGIGWVSNVVDVYDADLGQPDDPLAWSVEAPLSVARSHASAVTVGDLAIFAGGAGVGGTPFDTVDIYDDLNETWTTATLSVARLVGNAATVVGDRAYFAGGHFSEAGGPNMSDALDVYDAQDDHWESAALPSGPRGYLGVTAVGNTLLIGGGLETGFVASDLVEMLNVGTGQWSAPQHLSQPGSRAATTIGGMAFFADNGTEVVDVYEPVGVSYCSAETNSTGSAATISASGSKSVVANDLTLHASQLALNKFSYFLTSQTQGFVIPPGSQGNLCLGGTIGRFANDVLFTGGAGEVSLQVDLTDLPIGGGTPVLSGETWNFQLWFRDNNPGTTSNFTDAVSITFN